MTDRCTCGPCPVHPTAHSPRGIRSQAAENASGVPTGGSGHSEAVKAVLRQMVADVTDEIRANAASRPTINVERINYPTPLAEGTCNHHKPVWFNLAAGFIRHRDGFNSRCDGWVLTHAEAEAETHGPESPGTDGHGYGRCVRCGNLWPCPNSRPTNLQCNRTGMHNRCAITGGWANHDAGLTAHDMPTPRTIGHPTTDPGDGRTRCGWCRKYVWEAIHSCRASRTRLCAQCAQPFDRVDPDDEFCAACIAEGIR